MEGRDRSRLGLRGLGRNVGGTLARQTLAVAVGMVLTVMLARVLHSVGTGELGLALFMANVCVTVFGLGLSSANVYAVGRDKSSTVAAVQTSLRLGLLLSLLGLAVGLTVIRAFGGILFPTVPTWALVMALALFPVMLLEALLLSVLQGREDFAAVNRVGMLVPVATLVFAAVLVAWASLGVRGALLAYGGAHLCGLLATVSALRRHRRPPTVPTPLRDYTRAALRYGWRANLGNIVALANYRIDLYVLNLMLAAAAVAAGALGVYAVAIQIAERLWLLSAAVSFVILPRIAALHDAEPTRRRITPLMVRWVFLATVGLSIAVGVLGVPVIRLMGPEYARAVPVLACLLPGVALLAVARVISADLAARGRPGLNVLSSLAALAVEVVGLLVLVPRLGLIGAGLASTFGYGVQTLLCFVFYARVAQMRPWTPLLPTRDDRQVVTVLGALLVGWFRAAAPGDRLRD